MQHNIKVRAAILFAFCLTLFGCSSNKDITPASKGAITGAVTAGGIGGIIGATSGSAAGPIGALGGAVIGSIAGAYKYSEPKPEANSAKPAPKDEEVLIIVEKPISQSPTSEILESIYFDSSSDQLSPTFKSLLEDIAIIIEDDPDLKLTINGYADSSGRPHYDNDGLAKRRAKAVKIYLKSLGINSDKIYMGSGGIIEKHNETIDGRAHNRKVDVIGTK